MKTFRKKLAHYLYFVHQIYLCLLPAGVNFLILFDAQRRGGVFSGGMSEGWTNLLGFGFFIIFAFIVAAYLGVVAELKNFPTKLWKAVWVVLSIPVLLLGLFFFGDLDIFDYFVILFFTEVIGLFSLFLKIVLRRFTFELKRYKKEWLTGLWVGGLFSVLFGFSIWVLLSVVHAELTWFFVCGLIGMAVVAFLNYGKMIDTAEREEHNRAVMFILIGILTWFASFFVAGIIGSIFYHSI
ncbi:hypothetical protein ACFL21_03135 [Patescibacteria group bacterium]